MFIFMDAYTDFTPEDQKSSNSNSLVNTYTQTISPVYPEKEEVTIDYSYQYRFILTYGGLSVFSYGSCGLGQCEVVVRRERCEDRAHVLIYEPQNTGTTSVTNWIEHLATQIYWGFLSAIDPTKVTWTIRYNEPNTEGCFFPITLYWDGMRFFYTSDKALGLSPGSYRMKRAFPQFWKFIQATEKTPGVDRKKYLAAPLTEPMRSLEYDVPPRDLWQGYEKPLQSTFTVESQVRKNPVQKFLDGSTLLEEVSYVAI